MSRSIRLLIAGLLVWPLAACPRAYVDDDLEAQMARQIIVDMPVEDGLDTTLGDKTDWKRVVPMANGDVTLTGNGVTNTDKTSISDSSEKKGNFSVLFDKF